MILDAGSIDAVLENIAEFGMWSTVADTSQPGHGGAVQAETVPLRAFEPGRPGSGLTYADASQLKPIQIWTG